MKIRAAAPRRWSPSEGEGARPSLADMAERIERRAKPDLSADDVIAEIDRGRESR
ncbi:antitoxin [Nocardiopsis composta]